MKWMAPLCVVAMLVGCSGPASLGGDLPSEVTEWGFSSGDRLLLKVTVFNDTDRPVNPRCVIGTLDADGVYVDIETYRPDEIIQAGGSGQYSLITDITVEGYVLSAVVADCWVNE